MIKIEGELGSRNLSLAVPLVKWPKPGDITEHGEHNESHLNFSSETKAKKQKESLQVRYNVRVILFTSKYMTCEGTWHIAAFVLIDCHR